MATYVTLNSDGSIASYASWKFPGSTRVDYEVVRGYDGKLYKKGEEPVKSEDMIKEENFRYLRAERDKKLQETDYLVMPDYPISKTALENVMIYRQALRDITEQEGAPWTPDTIEWPEKNLD